MYHTVFALLLTHGHESTFDANDYDYDDLGVDCGTISYDRSLNMAAQALTLTPQISGLIIL